MKTRSDDPVEAEFAALKAELTEFIGGDPTIVEKIAIERIAWLQLHLAGLDAKIAGGGEFTAVDRQTYASFGAALADALAALDPSPGASGQGGLRRVERVVVDPAFLSDEELEAERERLGGKRALAVITDRLAKIGHSLGFGAGTEGADPAIATDNAPALTDASPDVLPPPEASAPPFVPPPEPPRQRLLNGPSLRVPAPLPQPQPPALLDQLLREAAGSRPAYMRNPAIDPEYTVWSGSTED